MKTKKGLALPIIAAIALCLALLGLGLLQLSFGSRIIASTVQSDIYARNAADAGLERALYSMNVSFYTSQSLPTEGSGTLETPLGSGVSFDYTIEYYDPEHYLITSIGTAGRKAVRTVYALTRMASQFDYALFVTNSIVMKSGALVDGYDTTVSPIYGGENSGKRVTIGSNTIESHQGTGGQEGIVLNSDVIITGDIATGKGSEPEYVISSDRANITGSTYAMSEPFTWSPIKMPTEYETILQGSALSFQQTTQSIGFEGTLTQAQIIECTGNLNIGNSGILEVKGDVKLHITGDLNLGQGAQISVMPESRLIIYLDGVFDSTQSNYLNNATLLPGNFIIYGTGTQRVVWDIGNSGTFYGVIYAPYADIIVRQGGDIFGSVAGRSADLRNSGDLHYDRALANPVDFPAGYVIDRWWEKTI